jgi:hypothetical protein
MGIESVSMWPNNICDRTCFRSVQVRSEQDLPYISCCRYATDLAWVPLFDDALTCYIFYVPGGQIYVILPVTASCSGYPHCNWVDMKPWRRALFTLPDSFIFHCGIIVIFLLEVQQTQCSMYQFTEATCILIILSWRTPVHKHVCVLLQTQGCADYTGSWQPYGSAKPKITCELLI